MRSLVINQNGEIFAGTYPGSIYRSKDSGANWTLVNDLYSIGAVRSLAVNANGHIFAGTHFGGAIFRSTDNGETWTQVYFGDKACGIFSLVINREGHIFAGVNGLCGVLRSKDNGEHWEQAHGGLPNYAVSTLALNSKGELFAGGNFTGVYHSRNNGDSWARADTNLGFFVQAYTMVAGVTDQLFMGTYGSGAFRSRDNGVTWTALPFPYVYRNTYVYAVAFDHEDYLLASIDGSIFRSSQPSTSVRESNNNLPALFLLEQNYPNPFNPNTTISFSMPRKSYVELKIYSTLGKEVITLLRNQQKDAGRHTMTWNGRDAAGQAVGSGIYFLRLRAKNFVQTRKLLLVE